MSSTGPEFRGLSRVGRPEVAAAALTIVLVMCGCGKAPTGEVKPADDVASGAPSTDDAGPGPGAKAPVARATDGPDEPQKPDRPDKADPDDFDSFIARATALERDTMFSGALKLCRKTRSRFARHPRFGELKALMARLTEERRIALPLPFAVEKLGSERVEEVMVAKDALCGAGEVGRLFLRKAVRDGPGAVAAEAAKLLAELRDEEGVGDMLTRVKEDTNDPPAGALFASLERTFAAGRGLSSLPEFARFIVDTVDDEPFAWRSAAAVLCRVFENAAAGVPEKYNELVGDTQGHARLKAYVERAMESDDKDVADWASRLAAVAGCRVRGFRGSYYHGTEFEKLVFERVDSKIKIGNRAFPYPDGRQENISARWTGVVHVTEPGRYTFYSAADDGQRLWVGGEKPQNMLVDDWSMHGVQEQSGEIDLDRGFHEIRVDFMQGGGEAEITISWKGPGFGKRVLTDEHVYTLPWPGMKKE